MLKFIDELDPKEGNIWGNKAIGLSILYKHKFKIPYAFVISHHCNLETAKTDILKACDNIGGNLFAIRSSANVEDSTNHSFAGMFKTFLNVKRNEILKYIQKLMSTRDLNKIKEYCKKKGINKSDIKISVIVQKMITPDFSGVCFSMNPINNTQEIIVEITKKHINGVVSGKTTPNRYIVSYKGSVKEKSEKIRTEKMKDKIHLIAKDAIRIQNIFSHPMDIEFVIKQNEIYYLQTRPITTVKI